MQGPENWSNDPATNQAWLSELFTKSGPLLNPYYIDGETYSKQTQLGIRTTPADWEAIIRNTQYDTFGPLW